MKKCVIFDMDGTLADTTPLCIAAVRRAAGEVKGTPITDEELGNAFGPAEEGVTEKLTPTRGKECLALFLRYYEEMHPDMCPGPFEGMVELLREIKARGMALALVTGKGRYSMEVSLRQFGMEQLFDVIETGNIERLDKTDGIRRVLQQLDIPPEDAIYVGDLPSDITASRKVGVPVVAAAWVEGADVDELLRHQPDHICYSVQQLADLLLK